MFVEKLTKEDIVEYLKENVWSRNTGLYGKNPEKHIIYFDVENGEIHLKADIFRYVFSDFSFSEYSTFLQCRTMPNNKYLKLMYSRFGEDYKKEFLKFRETEKARVLNSFDDETKNFASNLSNDQGK